MAKKVSKFLPPSHRSKTRPGTPPNASKKPAVIGSGRNRPAKGYDPVTKTWHQKRALDAAEVCPNCNTRWQFHDPACVPLNHR